MKTLFENATLLPEYGSSGSSYVLADGAFFTYAGKKRPEGAFDRVVDCCGKLLIPAFYNTHCHAAMTLFRGIGDDLPLFRWLNEKIFPAEDKLTQESVYWGSLAAIAEMLSSGCVSFSDMYMFEDATAKAVIESGVKANLARGLVSFDENIDMKSDRRFAEAVSLYRTYNGAENGRLKIDMALHAEYTNVKRACRHVAEYCRENGIRIQLHLSETQKEHEECISKHGVTPAEFFNEAGVFEVPVTAAHCVWLSDGDIRLLAEKHVAVSHNPASNLKLGSGVMPYRKLTESGIMISLGTDGAASNNSLNMIREMQLAALLHKGISRDATETQAGEMLKCATSNGAAAQGREDCGRIAAGSRADAVLIDLDTVNTIPSFDPYSSIVYSADRANVFMTMCDGVILYEKGEYKSIDIERVKFNVKHAVSKMFG